MKTQLTETAQNAPWGDEAEQILRTCVHCGFCTAVCPTYQLTGNELEGPRGRIYLMHSMLQGNPVGVETQQHLDSCLTCRACEAMCPSGVRYGRLADIGRGVIEKQVPRPATHRWLRWGLRQVLPYPRRFGSLLGLGRLARPILPSSLRQQVPPKIPAGAWPTHQHARKMLVLQGCVQPSLSPNTNAATAQVLNKLGITVLKNSPKGCCGAVSYHLAAHAEGLQHMRRLIDQWWPYIEQEGIEAIVITASGCGSTVKEYGELFKDDPQYAEKAAQVSALAIDIGELLTQEDLSPLVANLTASPTPYQRVALHTPCTLQHGQRQLGLLEPLLQQFGYELTEVPDAHLCCGSAGTYSILQKTTAQQLLNNKLTALHTGQPDVIATANIGCQMHLQSEAKVPVKHWIELIALQMAR